MKFSYLCVPALLLMTSIPTISETSTPTRIPVLVELFTSEGCSSCPPADAYLRELDRQPVPDAQVIVLSEHVDYWNHIGWKDPYSSHLYSERQDAYVKRFGLDSSYTPQMVVDGAAEFVGSDRALGNRTLNNALHAAKIPIRLSEVSVSHGVLRARIETGPLASTFATQHADLYLAVALNQAKSAVSRGENSGRTLSHVAVLRSLHKVGTLQQGGHAAQDFEIKLDDSADPQNLRVIAFLQESGQGRILGAADQAPTATP